MRTIASLLFSALLVLASFASANAGLYPSRVPLENHPFYQLFGVDLDACSNPCWIDKRSDGGDLQVAQFAVLEVMAAQKHVVINAGCSSACAYFAAWVAPYVSLGSGAELAFHMGRAFPLFSFRMEAGKVIWKDNPPPVSTTYIKPRLPEKLAEWVKKHSPPGAEKNDGFPDPDKKPLIMNLGQAVAFWPRERSKHPVP